MLEIRETTNVCKKSKIKNIILDNFKSKPRHSPSLSIAVICYPSNKILFYGKNDNFGESAIHTLSLERFPIECRKTKTKVILLLPIATDVNNTTSKTEFDANTCNWRQARENLCSQNTIGFGLDSHWLRKCREFC